MHTFITTYIHAQYTGYTYTCTYAWLHKGTCTQFCTDTFNIIYKIHIQIYSYIRHAHIQLYAYRCKHIKLHRHAHIYTYTCRYIQTSTMFHTTYVHLCTVSQAAPIPAPIRNLRLSFWESAGVGTLSCTISTVLGYQEERIGYSIISAHQNELGQIIYHFFLLPTWLFWLPTASRWNPCKGLHLLFVGQQSAVRSNCCLNPSPGIPCAFLLKYFQFIHLWMPLECHCCQCLFLQVLFIV